MTEVKHENSVAGRLSAILGEINVAHRKSEISTRKPELIAVSKTKDADTISLALNAGHRIFGENRVQEAASKWPGLRERYDGIDLHLIGPLQSNKAADAVALFDVIQTVDRDKIARVLSTEMIKQGRPMPVYVQVNTGLEAQKAGINPQDVGEFVERCRSDYALSVRGLMCIPPIDENPGPHFALLRKLALSSGLPELSMGMSGDYVTAISFGATHVRVGSAIFGARLV